MIVVERRGRRIVSRSDGVEVRAYAPGDGNLSFTASYDGDARGISGATYDEAVAICPSGWEVYMDGPYPRARQVHP